MMVLLAELKSDTHNQEQPLEHLEQQVSKDQDSAILV